MRFDFLFRRLLRIIWTAIWAAVAWVAFALLKPPSQDLPWAPLRLNAPVGLFTGRKLVALRVTPPLAWRCFATPAPAPFAPWQ